MATDYKKASDITQKTNIDLANDKIMAVNGTSNYNIPMQSLKSLMLQAAREANIDGIFVLTHSSDNTPMLSPLSNIRTDRIPEGLVIVEGSKNLIIATHIYTAPWSSLKSSVGTNRTKAEAMLDWDGKANTAEMLAHTECQGATAASICNSYEALQTYGRGMPAGSWWLPSEAQLTFMLANKDRINYAMGLIGGDTLGASDVFCSSTPSSINNAWILRFDGLISNISKTDALYVIPVSDLSHI